MAFLEFLRRVYDMESSYLGPEGAGQGPGGGGVDDMLGQLQMGLLQRRHDQAMQQHAAPPVLGGPVPEFGGGSGPVNFGSRPDAGDLYDMNYSNGDPGLLNLFGSAPPERRVDGPRPFRRDERR